MTTSCTSNIGTIGYSAGSFSRVMFCFSDDGHLLTYTYRARSLRVDSNGTLVSRIWTELYRGHFNEVFIDTSLIQIQA